LKNIALPLRRSLCQILQISLDDLADAADSELEKGI